MYNCENNWIANEFKNIVIDCGRTINRFINTMSTLSKKLGKSIVAASNDAAEAKAIYRLLKGKKLNNKLIMNAHKKQTLKNISDSEEKVILSIQDTTEIDYTNLKKTVGLGVHGSMPNSRGLIVHSNIAITTSGIALGLLDQKIWARPPEERGKRKTRRQRPIEEKESYKWLESMQNSNKDVPENVKIINICDREGDIFEFFHKAISENKNFLVRVVHDRKLDATTKMFEKISKEDILGVVNVEIPRDTRNNNKKRTASLEVRCSNISMPAPDKLKKNYEKNLKLEIRIIHIKEVNAPKDIEPIEWYLATNLEIQGLEDAFEKVQWYVQRWKIERFHYVLKSGCKVEELQQDDAEGLKKLILMYSIIAIRILAITYLAREHSDLSCEIMFEEEEWKVLYMIANKTYSPPKKIPTIGEVVSYLAKLGGFLGRKNDGDPGAKVIWRGLKELDTVLSYYKYLIPKN